MNHEQASLMRSLPNRGLEPEVGMVARVVKTLLYRCDVDDIREPASERAPGIETLAANKFHRLRELWPVPLEKMRKRHRRGDECYVAFLEGKLVHYSWVQSRGWHYIGPAGRYRRVRPGEFWIYHCRTAEQARGRGLYPAVLSTILRRFAERGFQTGWIYTTAANVASQKGIIKAGWRLDSIDRALVLMGRTLPLWTTRSPIHALR